MQCHVRLLSAPLAAVDGSSIASSLATHAAFPSPPPPPHAGGKRTASRASTWFYRYSDTALEVLDKQSGAVLVHLDVDELAEG